MKLKLLRAAHPARRIVLMPGQVINSPKIILDLLFSRGLSLVKPGNYQADSCLSGLFNVK
jgi:hypothetical protein